MTNGEKIKEIFPDAEFDNAKPFTDGRWETMNLDTENSNRAQYKPTQLRVYADWWNAEYKDPTTKNDLEVDCIDRAELLKAIDTWDKFGCDADTKLVPYQDHYIPYIHYDDIIKCIKSMPPVTPQTRKGYLSIDDVMAVFDDFMCGEVDEDGTETFLEMLKDKADMREVKE